MRHHRDVLVENICAYSCRLEWAEMARCLVESVRMEMGIPLRGRPGDQGLEPHWAMVVMGAECLSK